MHKVGTAIVDFPGSLFMKNSPKYRAVTCTLAGIFFLFNVGVPIVVAACPMMTADDAGGMCESCFDPSRDGNLGFLPYSDTSCCSTTVASEANRVEFLRVPAATVGIDIFQLVGILPPLDIPLHGSYSRLASARNTGPLTRDIPVLFSALLI